MTRPDSSSQHLFPRLKPLTEEESAAQHAAATWQDIRSTDYGPRPLRRHTAPVNGLPAYRFPYADRAYLLHRDAGGGTWAVTLYAAPCAPDPADAVRDTEPLVTGAPTRKAAVTQLVRRLYGTRDDHGYHRSRDSCPGCDHFNDTVYDELP